MGCPHGMPTPGSCIDCMDEGLLPPATKTWAVIGPPFAAQFDGTCSCAEPIEIGMVIKRWDYGAPAERTAYTHLRCNPR